MSPFDEGQAIQKYMPVSTHVTPDQECHSREFAKFVHVVAPFSKGQDGFCDYLYKVSTKQTPRQSSHSTAPIEGKDKLDR